MTLRLSSAKKDSVRNIFLYTLERFRAVLLFYAILLALLGPMSLLVQFWAGSRSVAQLPDLLGWGLPLGMALLMPLLIFNYVNNKQALDVFHAAPVRRETLYFGGYLAGLALVLVPLALFGGLSALVRQLCFGSGNMGLLYLLNVGVSAFSSYSLMVFVMINCGTMFESIVYYLVLNIGYPALVSTLFSLLQYHAYGYQQTANSVESLLFSGSPYYLLTRSSGWETFRLIPLLAPLALGIALALLGRVLYRRRKSEAAGQSFAYRPLFFIGAVLTCLSAGMVFLLLSSGDSPIRAGVAVMANLIGMIAYAILDTVRNRGFRKIRRTAVTALCIACAASGLFGLSAATGIFGYENRVPDLDDVVRVKVGMPTSLSNDTVYSFNEYREITLEEPESIKLVLDFHQAMVAEKQPIQEYQNGETRKFVTTDRNGTRMLMLRDGYDRYLFDDGRYAQSEYGTGGSVQLTYELKNGRTMARHYSNYPFVLTKPLYRLLQTQEYRTASFEADLASLKADSGVLEISSVSFSGYSNVELDSFQITQLQDAMRLDMSGRPSGFLAAPEALPVYRLSMRVWQPEGYWNYSTGSCGIYDSDGNTLALLRQWDALPKLQTNAYEGTVVGYIPQEKRDAVMGYPQRDAGIFYHAGRFALCTEYSKDPYAGSYEMEESCYEPLFVTLTAEQYQALMQMVTQIRLTEEGSDVVIIGSVNYLVFPEYVEDVRALILSASEYQPVP